MTASRSSTSYGRPHVRSSSSASAGSIASDRFSYVLLNDQPISSADEDLLDTADIAEGIASLLLASRAASPFVLALDADWGMGKSTLLRLIQSHLPAEAGVVTISFNAWTAEEADALEGLIKRVLMELDPNIVRRYVRRLARQQRVMLAARLVSGIAARFFGMTRLVNELWNRLGGDANSRNEMRDLIQGMLSDWIGRGGSRSATRALVVFIDDLDRCSDDVVVKMCDAIKLYLDAPGLIFVMACDQSVLARGVSSSARSQAGEGGGAYLEKIIQVAYRVPPPEVAQIRRLIHGYAQQSGTADLIDATIAGILSEGTDRNPRKIKRILNSFVLEYRLDPAWRKPPLGSAQLVRAVLLQHLYTSFYDLLIHDHPGGDPIGQFLDYAEIRERAGETPPSDDPWWSTLSRAFQAQRLALRFHESVEDEIERLEKVIPPVFQELAHNDAFVALLRGIGDSDARQSLRAQLIHRPLATEVGVGVETRQQPYGRIVIYTLLEDHIEAFDRLTKQLVGEVRAREPNTLVYIVHTVHSAPMQRILYEVYRDQAAYEAHKQQPYVLALEANRKALVLATNTIDLDLKYRVAQLPSVDDLLSTDDDTSEFERPDYP
jgi:quinol monooxygenase YgiN